MRLAAVVAAITFAASAARGQTAPTVQILNVPSGMTMLIDDPVGIQDLDFATFQFFVNGADFTPYFIMFVGTGAPEISGSVTPTSIMITIASDLTLYAFSARICTVGGLCGTTEHLVRDTLATTVTNQAMPSYAFGNGCLSFREYTLCTVQVTSSEKLKVIVADGFKTSGANPALPAFSLRVFSSPNMLVQDCPPEFGDVIPDAPLTATVVSSGAPPAPGAGPGMRLALVPATPVYLPIGTWYFAAVGTTDQWNWCEAAGPASVPTDVWTHWGGAALVAPYRCDPPPATPWCLGYSSGVASIEVRAE